MWCRQAAGLPLPLLKKRNTALLAALYLQALILRIFNWQKGLHL
jgi:hypothetical protein